MIFIVALYQLCCTCLHALDGVQPQEKADNLKDVSQDPEQLLRAARFATAPQGTACRGSLRLLLAGAAGKVVDSSSLPFLAAQALVAKEKEQEEEEEEERSREQKR